MPYLPNQQPSNTAQDSSRQARRLTQKTGLAGTFMLAALTSGGETGYLKFDSEGRLIDAKQPT